MSDVCNPTQTINNYSSGSYAIDPCNASSSIGIFDKPATGSECPCRSGYKPTALSHTFNSSDIVELGYPVMSGELSFYIRNVSQGKSNVTIGLVNRGSGSGSVFIYQKSGNYGTPGITMDMTNISSLGEFKLNYPVESECRWTFRGF